MKMMMSFNYNKIVFYYDVWFFVSWIGVQIDNIISLKHFKNSTIVNSQSMP